MERLRYGAGFSDLLRAAEARAAWGDEELAAYRDGRLRAFVRYAAETVPFWRRRFRELGLEPADVAGLDDLAALPVLAKRDVQDAGDELVSGAVSERDRLRQRTSGTTGTPLLVWTTRAALQEQWAVWWRWWGWHGIRRGTWCGYFTGRPAVPAGRSLPPYWRVNRPGRQVRFSTSHMSSATLGTYVAELRRRRLPWLHGWPPMLALVAAHVVDTGDDLGYLPDAVTVGSGILTPQRDAVIAEGLGIRARQHYGMVEAAANFSECELGGLHVDEDFAAVEFVPDPGGSGHRVVGTNFTNPAFPLLRYETGDLVELGDGPCPCGRPGRIVRSVDGRLEDYVVLPSGARATGVASVFAGQERIREAQVLQHRPGELVVKVVPAPGYTPEDQGRLVRSIGERLGGMTAHVEVVERLEPAASGKPRLVVSSLPEGTLATPAGVAGAGGGSGR